MNSNRISPVNSKVNPDSILDPIINAMYEPPGPRTPEQAIVSWTARHVDEGTPVAFWASVGDIDLLLGCVIHGRMPAAWDKFPCDEQPAYCDPVEILWPLDLPQDIRDEVEALDERWYFEEMAFEAERGSMCY